MFARQRDLQVEARAKVWTGGFFSFFSGIGMTDLLCLPTCTCNNQFLVWLARVVPVPETESRSRWSCAALRCVRQTGKNESDTD